MRVTSRAGAVPLTQTPLQLEIPAQEGTGDGQAGTWLGLDELAGGPGSQDTWVPLAARGAVSPALCTSFSCLCLGDTEPGAVRGQQPFGPESRRSAPAPDGMLGSRPPGPGVGRLGRFPPQPLRLVGWGGDPLSPGGAPRPGPVSSECCRVCLERGPVLALEGLGGHLLFQHEIAASRCWGPQSSLPSGAWGGLGGSHRLRGTFCYKEGSHSPLTQPGHPAAIAGGRGAGLLGSLPDTETVTLAKSLSLPPLCASVSSSVSGAEVKLLPSGGVRVADGPKRLETG